VRHTSVLGSQMIPLPLQLASVRQPARQFNGEPVQMSPAGQPVSAVQPATHDWVVGLQIWPVPHWEFELQPPVHWCVLLLQTSLVGQPLLVTQPATQV